MSNNTEVLISICNALLLLLESIHTYEECNLNNRINAVSTDLMEHIADLAKEVSSYE